MKPLWMLRPACVGSLSQLPSLVLHRLHHFFSHRQEPGIPFKHLTGSCRADYVASRYAFSSLRPICRLRIPNLLRLSSPGNRKQPFSSSAMSFQVRGLSTPLFSSMHNDFIGHTRFQRHCNHRYELRLSYRTQRPLHVIVNEDDMTQAKEAGPRPSLPTVFQARRQHYPVTFLCPLWRSHSNLS